MLISISQVFKAQPTSATSFPDSSPPNSAPGPCWRGADQARRRRCWRSGAPPPPANRCGWSRWGPGAEAGCPWSWSVRPGCRWLCCPPSAPNSWPPPLHSLGLQPPPLLRFLSPGGGLAGGGPLREVLRVGLVAVVPVVRSRGVQSGGTRARHGGGGGADIGSSSGTEGGARHNLVAFAVSLWLGVGIVLGDGLRQHAGGEGDGGAARGRARVAHVGVEGGGPPAAVDAGRRVFGHLAFHHAHHVGVRLPPLVRQRDQLLELLLSQQRGRRGTASINGCTNCLARNKGPQINEITDTF